MDGLALEGALRAASDLLAYFTEGRWTLAQADAQSFIWLQSDEASCQLHDAPSWLRAAWQLAVVSVLDDYPWPVVLEDPWNGIEATMKSRLEDGLESLSRTRQVVLFTPLDDAAPTDDTDVPQAQGRVPR
jgi:hypothetical protein